MHVFQSKNVGNLHVHRMFPHRILLKNDGRSPPTPSHTRPYHQSPCHHCLCIPLITFPLRSSVRQTLLLFTNKLYAYFLGEADYNYYCKPRALTTLCFYLVHKNCVLKVNQSQLLEVLERRHIFIFFWDMLKYFSNCYFFIFSLFDVPDFSNFR